MIKSTCFQNCGNEPIGIYPIVESAAECMQLIDSGISTLQLRIKDKQDAILEQEIQQASILCKQHQIRLFINDYWQLAIKYKTFGIHLGQEDLKQANLVEIAQAGLHLGISIHNVYEVKRALAIHPSYIAIGPIFPTTSKIMTHPPQGLLNLYYWQSTLNYPLVAIGGINQQNLPKVAATGVNGIAMISAITKSEDPLTATRNLIHLYKKYSAYAK